MHIHLHQTHHTVADFNEIEKYLRKSFLATEKKTGLHLFPELFLTGYPLQDLCLQKSFVTQYQALLERINNFSLELKENYYEEELCILMGGIEYELTSENIPLKLRNVIYKLTPGKKLESIYTKRLLPNYDIFDEQKYFSAGESPKVLTFQNKKIGLLICEDMWASSFHKMDPCQDLKEHLNQNKISLDLVINLSASPYFVGKDQKRVTRAMEVARFLEAPFIYLNRVGGEDEILFDGKSFVCDGEKSFLTLSRFKEDYQVYELEDNKSYSFTGKKELGVEYTWEGLFNARMNSKNKIPTLKEWADEDAESVLEALIFGFREYARKNGFNSFTIALSGGIDSTLVLTILRLALLEGQKLEAVYMPSIHSSPLSFDLSLKLCQNLGVPLSTMPIKFLHSTAKNLFMQTYNQDPFDGLADENIQSRIRGMLLYARSNQIGSMVVNTSNKSELAVGYSTQYGDSVGAISLLGDLFKTEVYRLCHFINKKYSNAIPEEIITRPPSAELRPDQLDSESLPPYDRLDPILEGILSYRYDLNDLVNAGFSEEEVVKVFNLYRKTEYKRSQFCPIIKIGAKSFGFGYRIPMSKKSEFYIQK